MPVLKLNDDILYYGFWTQKSIDLDHIKSITYMSYRAAYFQIETENSYTYLYNLIYGTLQLEDVIRSVAKQQQLIVLQQYYTHHTTWFNPYK